MALEPPCRPWQRPGPPSVRGCVACWQGRIPTSWWWPWRTSWPGLYGPCCGMAVSSRGPTSWHRRSGRACCAIGSLLSAGGEARWPDSRSVFRNPGLKNGALSPQVLLRAGTRESPSWPGFRLETGYVDADCSDLIAETPCRRGGPYVFKCRRGTIILGMMARPRRELAEPQGAQLLAQRLFRNREPELLPQPLHQVDDAPPHHPMDRRDRALLNDL